MYYTNTGIFKSRLEFGIVESDLVAFAGYKTSDDLIILEKVNTEKGLILILKILKGHFPVFGLVIV